MPLRDHFRPPTTKYGSWTSLHGMWPANIIQQLRKQLPPGFVAAPSVHLGPYFEIDIAAFESDNEHEPGFSSGHGAAATLVRRKPTWAVDTDVPEDDIFEVEIYKVEEERELVAVIEIVSPANKDRPEKRREFVGKCSSLLKKGIAVSIVDPVTIRHANLYADMMAFVGHADPTLGAEPPALYASSTRWITAPAGRRARLESWFSPMAVGEPLPPLRICLTDELALDFDLERSYESACEDLSIP